MNRLDSGQSIKIGGNTAGPHPSAEHRPVHYEEWATPSARGYFISDHMINEPPNKSLKVILIGAGAAGIDFLHHAPTALKGLNVDIVCYEKNEEIGGTCTDRVRDIPSASYQFAWRPNPEWKSYYSGAKHIWQYLKTIVDEEGMMRYIKLGVAVTGAVWQDEKSKWIVRLSRSDQDEISEWTEECDVLVSGTGFLNAWKWPAIPGLETFKGKIFHSAKYEEGFDLKAKRVAVIGSGSSGVQIVATIYQDVSKLYTWVRTPTWITAGFAQKYAGENGANFDYSEEQKSEWRQDPEKYRQYRKLIEQELNQRFKFVLKNTRESDEANIFAYKEMASKLGHNPRLVDRMIPKDFNVGCRRPTPGNGYLEALVGEKTTCYTDSIGAITPKGFVTADGEEVEVDVIICATGFDTSFRPRFPIIGLEGESLSKQWEKLPASYISVAAPKMPNYFMYTGPFGPVAQGSVLPLLTLCSNYVIQIIQKMRKQHIRRLYPKETAIEDFMEHAALYMQRTCWSDPCTSWFKQGTTDGPIIMWPGSRLAFFDLMETPNFEDYEIEYWSKNRWGWLGNGFSTIEFDGKSDITYYLDTQSGMGASGKTSVVEKSSYSNNHANGHTNGVNVE
ncbi:uncharacterized protein Z519_04017 [Cladophialophora bantiana CBS 173.52]|uniref:L-ornithine N(5)-oxygenase n=1 Tax=Cladophialophora bantiana (strain ATCC 10958 / CBS 173.52 / CDC B-1940 / NIH 8579) TaxID=1442370 RepID=A0A0D2HPS8_CLAB1|nr:uncharacterized protein Z519_04017 [Cladophialophora bantiana CBS 173.52]KIW95433.1 hypothetical protein Z519_04017 [Cladophialophora bantiana CBS 173.52]